MRILAGKAHKLGAARVERVAKTLEEVAMYLEERERCDKEKEGEREREEREEERAQQWEVAEREDRKRRESF